MAKTTAFFSFVWDRVDEAHPMMTELTEYAPMAKMKHATYLAAVLSVAAATANPTMAIPSPAVMCQVRSWNLPELQPKAMPAAPAKMKGGQVITKVMVVLSLLNHCHLSIALCHVLAV